MGTHERRRQGGRIVAWRFQIETPSQNKTWQEAVYLQSWSLSESKQFVMMLNSPETVRFSLVHHKKRMGRIIRTPDIRISLSRLSPAAAAPVFVPLGMVGLSGRWQQGN